MDEQNVGKNPWEILKELFGSSTAEAAQAPAAENVNTFVKPVAKKPFSLKAKALVNVPGQTKPAVVNIPEVKAPKSSSRPGAGGTVETTTGENIATSKTQEVNIPKLKELIAAIGEATKGQKEANKAERDTALSGKAAADKASYEAFQEAMKGKQEAATEEYGKHRTGAAWDRAIDALGKMAGGIAGLHTNLNVGGNMPKEYTPIYDKEAADKQTSERLKTEGATSAEQLKAKLASAKDVYDEIVKNLPEGVDINKVIPEAIKNLGIESTGTGKAGSGVLGANKETQIISKDDSWNKQQELISDYQKQNVKTLESINALDAGSSTPKSMAKLTAVLKPNNAVIPPTAIAKRWDELRQQYPAVDDASIYDILLKQAQKLLVADVNPDTVDEHTALAKKWDAKTIPSYKSPTVSKWIPAPAAAAPVAPAPVVTGYPKEFTGPDKVKYQVNSADQEQDFKSNPGRRSMYKKK